LQPVAWIALLIGVIGIVGYFVTIIILTIKAGIDPELSGIQLSWFDYWKTEVAALVIVALAALAVIPLRILDGYFSFLTREGLIGFVALGENCVFLAGWLSLMRRAKAKTLWDNSVTYLLAEIIKGAFANSRRSTKLLALFGGYLFINYLLINFGTVGIILSVGFNIFVAGYLLREAIQDQKLLDGMKKLQEGELTYQYEVEEFVGFRKEFAMALNGVHQVFLNSVMESMKNERMQTDLITNVSHDIKTPLTSIINYVDLLKRENIENERAKGYIEILEQKSHRLKHLTEDLVEASKISSGNIKLECMQIQMQEMIYQAGGEFADKFELKGLTLIENLPQESLYIRADGRRLWRVLENLYNNVAKYAMPNTRVYVDLMDLGTEVKFSIKNISEQRLNIEAKDLTERFIRGDISRSTEGSGLGLSIAKNLTELQGGKFSIYLDGDLFRVTITFPKLEALPEDMSINVLEENIEASLEKSLETSKETEE
ncbi:MAG: sensor histidine kinase, partial [Lachnospiraceae bacterium]|nr:sensor histidine kinase [Lachnospiraceae bacterium]